MTVRGQYGKRPPLPYTPGFEGAGVIDAAGPGLLKRLRGLKPGKRVAVISSRGGTWQEYVVVSAREVVPVPDDILDEQAATFFVNPATALVMTQSILKVPRGAWLLQTAAGSTLGRMVIRLGKHFGFRTINVVRRREQAQELVQAGGDVSICTADESIEKRVEALTGGAGVLYAIDAVGGATAGRRGRRARVRRPPPALWHPRQRADVVGLAPDHHESARRGRLLALHLGSPAAHLDDAAPVPPDHCP